MFVVWNIDVSIGRVRMSNAPELINAAKYIANYCRGHICTECPLNIGDRNAGILHSHCVCDYNVLRLPSTWQIDKLKEAQNGKQ